MADWNNKRCQNIWQHQKFSSLASVPFSLLRTVSHVYFSAAHADSRRGGINNSNFMAGAGLTQRGHLPRYHVVCVCVCATWQKMRDHPSRGLVIISGLRSQGIIPQDKSGEDL
jgi:hypothetical protein